MSSNLAESADYKNVNRYDYEFVKYGDWNSNRCGDGEPPCYIMAIDQNAGGKRTINDGSQKTTVFGKYKTELCRNYERFETCKYGSKCLFAHGFSELRPTEVPVKRFNKKPQNNFYNMGKKPPLCGAYMNFGYCAYGELCKYRHSL